MPHRHGKPFRILAKAPLVTECEEVFRITQEERNQDGWKGRSVTVLAQLFFNIVFLLHSLVCGLLLHISTPPCCLAEHTRDCSAPASRVSWNTVAGCSCTGQFS